MSQKTTSTAQKNLIGLARGKTSEPGTRGKIFNLAPCAWDYKNQSEVLKSKTYVQQDL
jgi:hypothetical protein